MQILFLDIKKPPNISRQHRTLCNITSRLCFEVRCYKLWSWSKLLCCELHALLLFPHFFWREPSQHRSTMWRKLALKERKFSFLIFSATEGALKSASARSSTAWSSSSHSWMCLLTFYRCCYHFFFFHHTLLFLLLSSFFLSFVLSFFLFFLQGHFFNL